MNTYIKLLFFVFFLSIKPSFVHAQSSKDQPNIIFILTDDQRWDALGYAGNPLSNTPQMDKLATQGVFFKNALVTTPICAASRASIITGTYERAHGYNFQTSAVKDEFMQSAYPYVLKEAGYYTGFYGKLGIRYEQQEQLFDVIESYDRNGAYKDRRGYFYKTLGNDTVHLTRYTGQKALDFIDQAPKDQPFSLSLSFSAPHAHDPAEDQYFWGKESDQWLADQQVPDPNLGKDKYFNALPEIVREGFNRTRWYWRYDTPEKYQHSVKGYHRMIADIDREIGAIREKLKDTGKDQNTVIILMGDNGHFLGERQLAGKWLMYDNSIRVPLVIYDPRQNNHLDIDQMALNVDVPATMVDLAGADQPAGWQGKSLVPFLDGQRHNLDRDTVLIEHLWEFANIPPSEGVRTNEWKYLRYVNDQSIEELYDLVKDPRETKNLAFNKKYHSVLTNLRNKTDELSRRLKDPYVGAPDGLMVEYIRQSAAAKVKDETPEFSWVVPDGAKIQQGYQLLVASSIDKINKNIGDVWDSGQLRSGQNSNIQYKGSPLQNNSSYYWKVRIWDVLNRVTQYADPQSFQFKSATDQEITTPNIFQVERIKPVAFKEKGGGSYFIDFGKDAFSTLEFNYQTNSPDTVIVRLGEQLFNGKINQDPQGNIRYQEVKVAVTPKNNTYQLNLPPDQRNTKPQAVQLPDTIPVIFPFRYAEIDNANGLKKGDVTQVAYFTYFEEDNSSFSSSDTVLNQVWDLCKYSIKATSFAGLYVDGDRERIPYEADAYLNQLTHYAVDQEYPIARRTIEYFMEYPTWPTEWQQHVALMFHADYMYTGNTELIEKYYEPLKYKTLMQLADSDGLISTTRVTPEIMKQLGFKDPSVKLRDITDWPPAQKDTGWKLATAEGERDGFVFSPINTLVNCFYYRNMVIMAEFAEILGKYEEAEMFRFQAFKAKKAINETLLSKETGVYVDGDTTDHSSLHSNMVALAFDVVPKANIDKVVDFIKTRGMACSVYGSQYLMDGLYKAGAADYALELMTATHDRSWWNMIAIGSTVSLEAWDMKYKPNSDWNHAWGAVPGNIVARRMWGIRPKTPGGSIVTIEPQLSKLKDTEIKVPFLKGVVAASYQRVNNRLQKYEFDLPANVSAELILKAAPEDAITLNGEPVNMAFGTIRLSPGHNEVVLKINSF